MTGCGTQEAAPAGPDPRLALLGAMFGRYQSYNAGRLPASEAELLEFAAGRGKWMLDKASVADPKELLVSARDGQPLQILYAKAGSAGASGICAIEAQGVDGVRLAATTQGKVEEITAADFEARFGAAAKK